jgi:hypothetical protein
VEGLPYDLMVHGWWSFHDQTLRYLEGYSMASGCKSSTSAIS